MLRTLPLVFMLFVTACAQSVMPMIPRLSDDEQLQADAIWHNLLTPTGRLDRQTLLDTLSFYHLYALGIDRATYHAEKSVDNNLVVMDIAFDHSRPLADAFTVCVLGPSGKLLRRESFTREEAESALNLPCFFTTAPTSQPAAPTPEQLQQEKDLAIRAAKLQAATQPDSSELRKSLAAQIAEIQAATQPAAAP